MTARILPSAPFPKRTIPLLCARTEGSLLRAAKTFFRVLSGNGCNVRSFLYADFGQKELEFLRSCIEALSPEPLGFLSFRG